MYFIVTASFVQWKIAWGFPEVHPHAVQHLDLDPPSSPWAPVKGRFLLASNKQLQLLILSHGVEATFHPSHLLFPEHFQKSPWQFSDLSQLFLRALRPGQPCYVLQLQALLWSWGPTEGHYCPFMGFTVWEVRWGRARTGAWQEMKAEWQFGW